MVVTSDRRSTTVPCHKPNVELAGANIGRKSRGVQKLDCITCFYVLLLHKSSDSKVLNSSLNNRLQRHTS